MMDLTELTDTELSELRAELVTEEERRRMERKFQADADALAARYAEATDRKPGDPWVQPTGAHNAYPLGWTATDEGRLWESLIPANSRRPNEAADPQAYRWWKDVTPAEAEPTPDPAEGDPGEPEPEVDPEWDGRGVQVNAGDLLMYQGVRYEVVQSHTTQPGWTPDAVLSLYRPVT